MKAWHWPHEPSACIKHQHGNKLHGKYDMLMYGTYSISNISEEEAGV